MAQKPKNAPPEARCRCGVFHAWAQRRALSLSRSAGWRAFGIPPFACSLPKKMSKYVHSFQNPHVSLGCFQAPRFGRGICQPPTPSRFLKTRTSKGEVRQALECRGERLPAQDRQACAPLHAHQVFTWGLVPGVAQWAISL